MDLRELLDRLPLRPEHRLSALLIAIGAIGLMSCAVCCGGCVYLFHDKPAPVAKQTTFQVDALPANVVAEADGVITPRTGPQVPTSPPLDAAALLAAAADDQRGQITLWERRDGLTIQTAGQKFCEPADGPREAARWRQALEENEALGLGGVRANVFRSRPQ